MMDQSSMIVRTPIKKRPRTDSSSSLSPKSPKSSASSPVFIKPSELFRKRLQQRNDCRKKFSPSKKATAALRRCKLPIETVEKIYSPLKCLQQQPQSSFDTGNGTSNETKSPSKCKLALSFSPLMKKLQRSPGRSQISFPVVRRSLQNSFHGNRAKHQATTITTTTNVPAITRVLDFEENAQPSFQDRSNHQTIHNFYPLCSPQIDWSLKTRMRIVINRTIPFHGTFNSVDEANGLNRFVRGHCGDDETELNFCSELHRHCLVWQHPHLPWMNLFPRQPTEINKPGSQVSSMRPPMFQISPTGSMADSLHSDFRQALHSLFKLLKSKYCPYFYLCANNFTVLFRASGVADCNEAHALITPTTIGFRRLLESESITYEMPFYETNKQQQSSLNNQDESSKTSSSSSGIEIDDDTHEYDDDYDYDDDDIDNNVDEDDHSSNLWLESLGLSQQDFPSLETPSIRRRRRIATIKSKDGKKKNAIEDESAQSKVRSLIRVNGIANLQSLLGLFINQRKTCITTSGPLAGIPPTILAPVAFHGAHLKPMSVRHKTVIATDGNRNVTTIDFNGPILPHSIYGMKLLFRRLFSQQENCNAKITIVRSTLRTYDQSGSFALESGSRLSSDSSSSSSSSTKSNCNPKFSVENLYDSGMDREFLLAICSSDRQHCRPIGDFEMLAQGIRYNRFVSGVTSTSSTKPMLNQSSSIS